MAPLDVLPRNQTYINGRFTAQRLSGVQRFATEITRAMDAHQRSDGAERPVLLVPPGQAVTEPSGLPVQVVGRLQGQLWEQLELPRHARDGLLVNLGNTAPVLGGRQVVVVHDAGVFSQPDAYALKFRLWYRLLQTVLLRTQARLVTVSEFSRTELVRHLRVTPDRVDVIPEGGDHILRVTPDDSVLARNGLEPGRFVLAVGNLAAHKNLRGLKLLAGALATRGMSLAISGGFDSAVFAGKTGNELPHPARYVGRVSDAELHALYRAAACFVFPSHYEGFGLPAAEAMSCGCAVVASSIPALREVCGDAALYCDSQDPHDIAGQVIRLLDDADLVQRLQAAGLEQARHFTWDRAAAALLSILRREHALVA